MCSRHGDTAKLNIDGAGFLFLLINLVSYLVENWMDSKQQYKLKVTAALCRWNGALRFVSVLNIGTGLFVFNTVLEKQTKAVIYFWLGGA